MRFRGGLFLAYRLARNHFGEQWALLATLGIWFATPLPVYMYFNPSYSHAASVFSVALFIFYWDRTRGNRTGLHWLGLGLCGGLMMDVYYPNAIFMLASVDRIPGRVLEFAAGKAVEGRCLLAPPSVRPGVLRRRDDRLFTFDDRASSLIRQRPERGGHAIQDQPWDWSAPWRWKVLFSSDHGLLSWTPIVCFAIIGLVVWRKTNRLVAGSLLASALVYYYLIASYPAWDGLLRRLDPEILRSPWSSFSA